VNERQDVMADLGGILKTR